MTIDRFSAAGRSKDSFEAGIVVGEVGEAIMAVMESGDGLDLGLNGGPVNREVEGGKEQLGSAQQQQQQQSGVGDQGMAAGEGFKREMRDLEELLSKLNPMAEEFVPPSLANGNHGPGPVAAGGAGGGHFYPSNFGAPNGHVNGVVNGTGGRRVRFRLFCSFSAKV